MQGEISQRAAAFDLLGGSFRKIRVLLQKSNDLGETSPKTLAMFVRFAEFLGEFKEHYS